MIALANINHAVLSGINVKVTDFKGPLLATYNVTGTGLTGAAKMTRPICPKCLIRFCRQLRHTCCTDVRSHE